MLDKGQLSRITEAFRAVGDPDLQELAIHQIGGGEEKFLKRILPFLDEMSTLVPELSYTAIMEERTLYNSRSGG
ncbi:hypothetical protein PS3A_36760 [Pseudomonas sp. 3A(2025)]